MTDHKSGDGERDIGKKEAPRGAFKKVSPKDFAPDGNPDVRNTGNEERRGAGELNRSMVRWTRVLGIFTVVLAITSILSTGIFGWQLRTMQGQLSEMRAANERPYLIASIAEYDVLRGDTNLNCKAEDKKDPTCFAGASVSIQIENAGRQPALIEKAEFGVFYDDVDGPLSDYRRSPSELLDKLGFDVLAAFESQCERGLDKVTRISPNDSVTIKCTPREPTLSRRGASVMQNNAVIRVRGAINYHGPGPLKWQSGFTFSYVPPAIDSSDGGYFKRSSDAAETYDVLQGREPHTHRMK